MGQTGVIGESKDYYFLVIISQIFIEKKFAVFAPK
jgi:hypothetical protein